LVIQELKKHTTNTQSGRTPGKEVLAAGGVKILPCWTGVKCDISSFEKGLFSLTYFGGEYELDGFLLSLLHLIDSTKNHVTEKGKIALYDPSNLFKRAQKLTGLVGEQFRRVHKQKDFDIYRFYVENKLPFDLVGGRLPLIFDDIVLTRHALKLAWAFYLTMKLHNVDGFPFFQRVRKIVVRKCTLKHQRFAKNYLSFIFTHIYLSLQKLKIPDEVELIKVIKNSLCYHVSVSLEQEEFPLGSRIDLIPIGFQPFFKKLSAEAKIEFFYSLLQSKGLCQVVPDSFVLGALREHRQKLSTPAPPLSEEVLKSLRDKGREFGKRVKKFYDPTKGFQPSGKASFSHPRDKGGLKGQLVYEDRLSNEGDRQRSYDRMEPMVIGLFGQPGSGKSSRIPMLLSILSELFPGTTREKLSYSRTCHTEHWDGYSGQPIVILDDLGQSLEGKDIKEFQTLVSCNPYVPPMAALEDKGRHFTSPIIIVTSNLHYGSPLYQIYKEQHGILDDAAFWRRFHFPLLAEKEKLFCLKKKPSWVSPSKNIVLPDDGIDSTSVNSDGKAGNRGLIYFRQECEFKKEQGRLYNNLWRECPVLDLFSLPKIYKEREKFHDNIRMHWVQVVSSNNESVSDFFSEFWDEEISPNLPKSLGFDLSKPISSLNQQLTFSAYPPIQPLPVRVEPIIEPLKVRTITAGDANTFCLKPLQRAMWLALGTYEQYILTHGTHHLDSSIQRLYESGDKDSVWISGDYTAATDSVSIEATKALMEGILESIDHLPTKRWAMKEVSPHMLYYPEGNRGSPDLTPVLQKSGQLMGSLLSFPLLCLLNDSTAQGIGLKPNQYLINGDDILMRCPPQSYSPWKTEAQKFGFSLSLGKNYVHPVYGTVNSQLIKDDKVISAGKQTVLCRKGKVLGECLRELEKFYPERPEVKDLFKSVNKQLLGKTIRSINVPISHGGLALTWGPRDLPARSLRTEQWVYIHDLLKKMKAKDGHIAVPYFSNRNASVSLNRDTDAAFNDPIDNREFHEDFLGVKEVIQLKDRITKNESLRILAHTPVQELPSLTFIQVLQVPYPDTLERRRIQGRIDHLFLSRFMASSETFNYERFREEFRSIGLVKGKLEASFLSLFKVVELEVGPDFLQKVRSSYTPSPFDVQRFKMRLAKLQKPSKRGQTEGSKRSNELQEGSDPLVPRERDIVEMEESEIIDFTREVDAEGEFLELYSQLDFSQDFFGNLPPERILELMNQKFHETIPEELTIPPVVLSTVEEEDGGDR
jgi:hypothetical protein